MRDSGRNRFRPPLFSRHLLHGKDLMIASSRSDGRMGLVTTIPTSASLNRAVSLAAAVVVSIKMIRAACPPTSLICRTNDRASDWGRPESIKAISKPTPPFPIFFSSAFPSAADAAGFGTIFQLVSISHSIFRLVALSSTTSIRKPLRSISSGTSAPTAPLDSTSKAIVK